MTDFEPEEDLTPVAHVTLVYNGPVAPHWELKPRYGDQKMLDDFWTRVNARLLLLPKHDPQFRRNRERVNRDAERERIICDWDLGDDDAESTSTVVAAPGAEQPAHAVEEAAVEEAAVEEVAVDEAADPVESPEEAVESPEEPVAEAAEESEAEASEMDESATEVTDAAEQPAGQS